MIEDLDIRLKNLRYKSDRTQKQVSDATGIDVSTISNYENGAASPSSENIRKLAAYYHVTCDFLLGLDNSRAIIISDDITNEQYAELKRIIDSAINLMRL